MWSLTPQPIRGLGCGALGILSGLRPEARCSTCTTRAPYKHRDVEAKKKGLEKDCSSDVICERRTGCMRRAARRSGKADKW
eukprot:1441125-Rhodomonas_salina.1